MYTTSKEENRLNPMIYNLKELLSLASFQLKDHLNKDEDISFAYDNIESALDIIVEWIRKDNGTV